MNKVTFEHDGNKHTINLDDPMYRGKAVKRGEVGLLLIDPTVDYGLPRVPNHEAFLPVLGNDVESEIGSFSQYI